MVCFFLESCLLDLKLHDLSGKFIQLGRHGIELRLDHCTRFIDKVDRFIRKETVCDVTVGQCRRCNKRGVRDLDAMINLIAVF